MPNNNIDSQVDETLEKCILATPRKSFFLFASAGSGKTYSLVLLLKKIRDKIGQDLMLRGKNVAVITYTNAATDEIINRLDYSPVFHISTIHSFVWDVIKYYQNDIKQLYCQYLRDDIRIIGEKLDSARNKTTKTYRTNFEKMNYLKDRLERAETIEKFVYNPNGSNPEYNALSHADVIKISAQMIMNSLMLQRIIAQRYPIFLIDESQDTKKELVDAFFSIQKNFGEAFTLGLLGDQKQRIYTDGKKDMVSIIPIEWEQPVKKMNYRSAKRIVKLANAIGKDIDFHAEQVSREDAIEGFARLFVVQQGNGINKDEVEQTVMKKMCELAKDAKWVEANTNVKILTLEHMMAARRLGFEQFFGPLSKVTKYQMTFLQGTVSELEFFTKEILPIADSIKEDGRIALEILKSNSPLLSKKNIEKSYGLYLRCREETGTVAKKVNDDHSIREVVKAVRDSQLLTIPEVIRQACELTPDEINDEMEEDLQAWVKVMDLPISMVRKYDDYVNQRTRFDTHQGVKGLEFERVMVIIDDSEAKGFMFSYDKLFGVKELTETDIKHIEAGEESSIDRTLRLFYVTCTRAKESLAIVMYTSDPNKVRNQAINKGWFAEQEIELL
ncbi:UvrD-helicase domain-containing protein [Porphyromonas loveana]|uniref:DNA 3'-5' helicase n=1 Tax=Porphyromonas loveana TaxID=1884669 RepID=A0A2U1FJB4_9PORP|nr:UvrD-helicase domain-containing protein [Porphyromonas loveana]PVZ12229.1 DNA helicase-2/ATP-dependent DNA helicase PcrA [Porphyromonas loveana]